MNRALLTQELRGIEARAAKTARLIHRQRTVVARLEKAGGHAVPQAHRLLRLLEDSNVSPDTLRSLGEDLKNIADEPPRHATRSAVEVRNSFAFADSETVGRTLAAAVASCDLFSIPSWP